MVRDRLYALEAVGTIRDAARLGTSGYVADSVPLALFASRQSPQIGFTAMLEQIVEAGGDTDSNASIACQVAGATLGHTGLPRELLERLPDRESIVKIATALDVALQKRKSEV